MWAIIVLVFTASVATAAPDGQSLSLGNGLYEVCTGSGGSDQLVCGAFVRGVMEGAQVGTLYGAHAAILAERRSVSSEDEIRKALGRVIEDCALMRALPGWEIPKEVAFQQVMDVVVKWLKEHPAERDGPSGLLIRSALAEAWPPARCPKD